MLPLYLLQLFDLSVYSLDDLPDSVFLNIVLYEAGCTLSVTFMITTRPHLPRLLPVLCQIANHRLNIIENAKYPAT
jgi:hypothetical protein